MNKIKLGQFFTNKNLWLTRPVLDFIKENLTEISTMMDPFAGKGDLFIAIKEEFDNKGLLFEYLGYDIDKELGWDYNDSLLQIPKIPNSFIISNPPYLSKNSCKKRGYLDVYTKYFDNSIYTDLYMIALEKMIGSGLPGIAIVPETVINSTFSKKNINKIVIIEPNPFEDTETPICVVCFNGFKSKETQIFKNEEYIGEFNQLLLVRKKLKTNKSLNLKFNDSSGFIAMQGVDSTNPKNKIRFLESNLLKYDFSKIKNSSRAITIISSPEIEKCKFEVKKRIILNANEILNDFRHQTQDVLLSPFKGNDKNKKRRRRLDFILARNIIEMAYINIVVNGVKNKNV